jgi:hypothetical protein
MDYLSPYSMGYYIFMAYLVPLVDFITEIYFDNNLSMTIGNPPMGGAPSSTSPTATPPVGGASSSTPPTATPPVGGAPSSTPPDGEVSPEIVQKVIDGIYTETIRAEFSKFKIDMAKITESLRTRHMMFTGQVTMNDPDVPGTLVMLLQDQTRFLNSSILLRME